MAEKCKCDTEAVITIGLNLLSVLEFLLKKKKGGVDFGICVTFNFNTPLHALFLQQLK